MVKKEYGGIGYFRIIAAILVIAIHTSPLLSVNEVADFILTRIVARIAVPFFFMTTGFFIYSKMEKKQFSYEQFYMKIGKIYGISILLYLPLNFYTGYFNGMDILENSLFMGSCVHTFYQ